MPSSINSITSGVNYSIAPGRYELRGKCLYLNNQKTPYIVGAYKKPFNPNGKLFLARVLSGKHKILSTLFKTGSNRYSFDIKSSKDREFFTLTLEGKTAEIIPNNAIDWI